MTRQRFRLHSSWLLKSPRYPRLNIRSWHQALLALNRYHCKHCSVVPHCGTRWVSKKETKPVLALHSFIPNICPRNHLTVWGETEAEGPEWDFRHFAKIEYCGFFEWQGPSGGRTRPGCLQGSHYLEKEVFDRPQLEAGIRKNQTISYLPPNNLRLSNKLAPFPVFDFKLVSV